MYIFAYYMLQLALFCAVGGVVVAGLQLWQGRAQSGILAAAQHVLSLALVIASGILLYALYTLDFSLEYVASYTDHVLPLFYRLTAFWAGQAGSLLFWALGVALCGSIFVFTRAYGKLLEQTRAWFWVFFFAIMGFLLLVLTTWSNPFMVQLPAPLDGNGMNPLLQNPGMIIHPPLLLLGYGGFTITCCAALAQSLAGQRDQEGSWIVLTRPFTLLAWISLTAGIILGAWWAYMELGWGGYWAWDPVENASLIPWLIGTAAIHTMIVEERRNKLHRTNVCLMALTTVSAFFATWLVRSGVIDSVHAFGSGGVALPLGIFVLAGLLLALFVPFHQASKGNALEGIESREGFLVLVAWVLLALSIIILLGTMWPVISLLWSAQPTGLDSHFYNKVCLPLGALLMALLALCPWLQWSGGLRSKSRFACVLCIFALTVVGMWYAGYQHPVSLIAAAASLGVIGSTVLLFADKTVRAQRNTLAAYGVHFGLALLALGVAFSGPYKVEADLTLTRGQAQTVGDYAVTLVDLKEGAVPGHEFLEARLEIRKDGKLLGTLAPQRRIYEKFGEMQFSEVDTIPSLFQEVYASMLGLHDMQTAVVKVSINPLVNWLWLGGTLMCLFPFLGLGRRRKEA